jgi:SAM-dependent methyltransferase
MSATGQSIRARLIRSWRSGNAVGDHSNSILRARRNPLAFASHWNVFLLVSIVCIPFLVPSQTSAVEVRSQRPRIFLLPDQVAELRQRIRSVEEVQKAYSLMRDFAYGRWMNKNLWITPEELSTVLVVYLVEDRDPRLMERIVGYLDYFSQAEGDVWTRPRMLKALALAYDWLADDLPPDRRKAIPTRMLELVAAMKKAYRHSDYNNQVYLQYGPLVYAGIALAHEPDFAAEAQELMRESERLLREHFIPTINQVGGNGDGGWHEGMAYFSFFAYELAQQLEAWRTATGEDLFEICPGLKGASRWFVYCTQPHDQTMAPVADIRHATRWGWQETALLTLLARRYRDGLAQWALRLVPPDHPVRAWPYVLWYDPSVKVVEPRTLPAGTLFSGIGWVATRSDWTDHAFWALFVCGPYYAGHQHSDQNSFLLSFRGELAVDAGGYGAKETDWHNTVLIGGGQRYFSADPRRYFGAIEPGSPCNTGRIVAFEENPYFTYALGDAGRAYPAPAGSKGTTFLRRFLYLRPATVVIDDWVAPTETDRQIRWLLHTVHQPQLIDGAFVAEGTGPARLIGRTLLPTSSRAEIIPRNFPKDNRSTWQLAIEPSRPGSTRLLHVLHAQLKEQNPDEFAMDSKVDEVGLVTLVVRASGREYRLELPPPQENPGWLEIRSGEQKILERRPLPAGILPYTPEGLRQLERWDSAYRSGNRPGWDVGRAASQLVEALETGLIRPCRVIELGCGLGNDARFLAAQGFDVTAVDIAPTAIARAEEMARKEGLNVRWLVADVLRMPDLGTFDLVYDRGCYHGVRRTNAREYVNTLLALTRPGSLVFILAGNAREPGGGGPPRVSEEEIRSDFSTHFEIALLRETRFDRRDGIGGGALAWQILLRRKDR